MGDNGEIKPVARKGVIVRVFISSHGQCGAVKRTGKVKYHRQSRWLEMVSASKAP
jgi:hypothetical protein